MKNVYRIELELDNGYTLWNGSKGRYTSLRAAGEAAKELIRSGRYTQAIVCREGRYEGAPSIWEPVNGRTYRPANYFACDFRVRRG